MIKEENNLPKSFEDTEAFKKRAAEQEQALKEKNAETVDEKVKVDVDKFIETDQVENVSPNGYIPVKLSTKGYIGAPKLFHMKNFDTADLMDLALSEQEDLPIKLISLFDKLIYEKDISVADFHTNEVIELLIVSIRSYLSRYIKDLPYDLTDEDWEYQKAHLEPEEVAMFKAELGKSINPKVTLDIDSFTYYQIDETTKTTLSISNKATGFSARFSYPRYGDVAVLKRFVDTEFKQRDKKFASAINIMKFREAQENKFMSGDSSINYRHIPDITESEKKELQEYSAEKGLFMIPVLKALHLVELDGKDVSDLSLQKRVELIKDDARFTHEILSAVNNTFEKSFKCGINTEAIDYLNPITQRRVTGPFLLRLDYLLQTINNAESDNITYDFV